MLLYKFTNETEMPMTSHDTKYRINSQTSQLSCRWLTKSKSTSKLNSRVECTKSTRRVLPTKLPSIPLDEWKMWMWISCDRFSKFGRIATAQKQTRIPLNEIKLNCSSFWRCMRASTVSIHRFAKVAYFMNNQIKMFRLSALRRKFFAISPSSRLRRAFLRPSSILFFFFRFISCWFSSVIFAWMTSLVANCCANMCNPTIGTCFPVVRACRNVSALWSAHSLTIFKVWIMPTNSLLLLSNTHKITHNECLTYHRFKRNVGLHWFDCVLLHRSHKRTFLTRIFFLNLFSFAFGVMSNINFVRIFTQSNTNEEADLLLFLCFDKNNLRPK